MYGMCRAILFWSQVLMPTNFMPPPTIKMHEYIFFFNSSAAHNKWIKIFTSWGLGNSYGIAQCSAWLPDRCLGGCLTQIFLSPGEYCLRQRGLNWRWRSGQGRRLQCPRPWCWCPGVTPCCIDWTCWRGRCRRQLGPILWLLFSVK